MNIVELIFAPYRIRLKRPFTTSKGIIKERKGYIINLKDSEGIIGVGDAAPLPEFGSETYEEASAALDNLKIELKIDINDLQDNLGNNLQFFNKFPALRHGIEQAILNLVSKKFDVSLTKLLKVNPSLEIDTNAAIGMLSPEEAVKEAVKKINEGFTTLKIKTGREKFNEDLKTIEAVRKAFGINIKLRIDSNGKWNLKEAEEYLKKLEDFNIEYAEQPVYSLNDFKELSKKTTIPLAADESIRSFNDAMNFIEEKAASFLVLKPMMLGGIIPVLKIIKLAEENNIGIVITSSFESAVGKYIPVFAASSVKNKTAHGLAINEFFEKDLIDDPFPIKNGKIILTKEL